MRPFANTRPAKAPTFEARRFAALLEPLSSSGGATRKLADEKFRLLKLDPRHPSLHLKRIDGFWSCRVGVHYRTLGIDMDGGILWFWIGTHADYNQMVK
jgi:hypothetical protein